MNLSCSSLIVSSYFSQRKRENRVVGDACLKLSVCPRVSCQGSEVEGGPAASRVQTRVIRVGRLDDPAEADGRVSGPGQRLPTRSGLEFLLQSVCWWVTGSLSTRGGWHLYFYTRCSVFHDLHHVYDKKTVFANQSHFYFTLKYYQDSVRLHRIYDSVRTF